MRKKAQSRSYVVTEDILPEAIVKTAWANEMLARGEALTVMEAVEKAALSRSAFYKYRDGVKYYSPESPEKVTVISLILEHRFGVLSSVLNSVAAMKGNIESINQSMPVQGVAIVTMNVNTSLVEDMGELLEILQSQEGVNKVEVVSMT